MMRNEFKKNSVLAILRLEPTNGGVKRAKKMRLLPLVQVVDFIEESSKQASHFLLCRCKTAQKAKTASQSMQSMIKTLYRLADYSSRRQVGQASLQASLCKIGQKAKTASQSMRRVIKKIHRLADYSPRPQVSQASLAKEALVPRIAYDML